VQEKVGCNFNLLNPLNKIVKRYNDKNKYSKSKGK
jgi:hypothetical protein